MGRAQRQGRPQGAFLEFVTIDYSLILLPGTGLHRPVAFPNWLHQRAALIALLHQLQGENRGLANRSLHLPTAFQPFGILHMELTPLLALHYFRMFQE